MAREAIDNRESATGFPAPLQRKPPIDQMDVSGGEGALIGGEVDRERGDLVRFAEPAHRLAVDELLADLLGRLAPRTALRLYAPVERRAFDRARTDGVAAHALPDEVGRHRLGEADHRRLRGAIDIAVGDAA